MRTVVEELRARQQGLDRIGRLALAIEGGGMRGVISAGMVAGLESHGFHADLFDGIFGSSGGSINGAYYAASQARFGTSIYYEDIVDRRFIDKRKAFGRGPVLSLEYLIGTIAENVKPLDYDAAIEKQYLRPIATDVATGTRWVFHPATSRRELQHQLYASASIPILTGKPHEYAGRLFLDASLSEAIPWYAPQDDGFDAILVLTTRPLGVGKSASGLGRVASHVASWTLPRGVRELARQRTGTSQARAAELETAARSGQTVDGVRVAAIAPGHDDPLPSQLEQDPEVLRRAARAGFAATERLLGVPESRDFDTQGRLERRG